MWLFCGDIVIIVQCIHFRSMLVRSYMSIFIYVMCRTHITVSYLSPLKQFIQSHLKYFHLSTYHS